MSEFSYGKLQELAAAARALARYVDDLEAELAAADEGAVLLRSQLADAEKSVEEKVSVAEAKLLAKGQGGWVRGMADCLGLEGTITEFGATNIRVATTDGQTWAWSPEMLEKL